MVGEIAWRGHEPEQSRCECFGDGGEPAAIQGAACGEGDNTCAGLAYHVRLGVTEQDAELGRARAKELDEKCVVQGLGILLASRLPQSILQLAHPRDAHRRVIVLCDEGRKTCDKWVILQQC